MGRIPSRRSRFRGTRGPDDTLRRRWISTHPRATAGSLWERAARPVEVELPAVATLGRESVLERVRAAERVLDPLLTHELQCAPLGETEALAERDSALERVALGRRLVGLTPHVPRLVGEYGDGPSRANAVRLVLEREVVEVVADLGSDDREITADGRHSVGVLDRSDVVARFVAADGDGLACDP